MDQVCLRANVAPRYLTDFAAACILISSKMQDRLDDEPPLIRDILQYDAKGTAPAFEHVHVPSYYTRSQDRDHACDGACAIHAPSLDDACDGSPCFAPPDLEAGSDLKYSCDEHQIGNSPLTFPAPFLRHGNTRQCAFVRARHSELSRLECVGRDHAPLCTSHDRVWVPFRGS